MTVNEDEEHAWQSHSITPVSIHEISAMIEQKVPETNNQAEDPEVDELLRFALDQTNERVVEKAGFDT